MNRDKPEIIAPAGNLEKLKFAVYYGADAVYFGGDQFNLRVQAGNFSTGDIENGLEFCSGHGVKVIFLMNSYLHQDDLPGARDYIKSIKKYPFSGIMVSDPGMLTMLRDEGVEADIHLSTQTNTLNHLAVEFWHRQGVRRIVLGRETGLEEIKKIREHTDIEIEVFAHGALCIAYSGRCLLSRFLSGRDANQGDCSQPCRWKYSLIEEKRPGNQMEIIEHAAGTEILSSKDLCLIGRLEEYIEAGVNAFKIEGRMKSLYHAANTVRIYKDAVAKSGSSGFKESLPFWLEELDLINHRPYTDDLFNEFGDMSFSGVPYVKKAMFLGYRESPGKDECSVNLKVFNPVRIDEEIEVIYPLKNGVKDTRLKVVEILDSEGRHDTMARPGEIVPVRFDRPVGEHAVFRKRL
jgi:putative protease